jgi:cobalt-zinc-cadmium efflux system outer membrane protein
MGLRPERGRSAAAVRLAAFLGTVSAAVLAAGCTAQRYRPAPIAAEITAAAFEARTLADPGLRTFEESFLGYPLSQWPLAEWDYRTLSVAALYFSPQLDEAQARAAESRAELVTAGARPNPSLGITPGIPSPYLLTLELSFPIETAGKRGYRVQKARNLAQAAQFDLAESAWTVRNAVRTSLLDYLVASRMLDLLRSEVTVREHQVNALRRVFSAGAIPRLELDAARTELSKALTARSISEEQLAEATAALATAIGIPVTALEQVRLSWADMEAPPSAESFALGEIQRDAVLNRLDVRSALAQYAAAESSLQVEIAKQYPDFNIGPGYTYEERSSYFTLGVSLTIPLLDRNQGPIAEAEARRRKAAAAFTETQSQVILQSARALAVYSAASKGLAEAGRFADLQASQREAIEKSVRVGERDRLDLDDAEILNYVAARARLEAVARAQRALGGLEDAVQRPLSPGDKLPTEPARSAQ